MAAKWGTPISRLLNVLEGVVDGKRPEPSMREPAVCPTV